MTVLDEVPLAEVPGAVLRRLRELPETLDGGLPVGPFSSARPGRLLRVVPGVGRFLARDGLALEIAVEPEADPAAVDALAHGGVLGALIHQRGELPLHATTLVTPDGRGAVALAGDSGAGKSTTAYELLRRGWRMLSDDLTRVTIVDGRPLAWPGRASTRLLLDACDAFGLDPTRLAPAPAWPDKYVVPVTRWNEPLPLAAVVCLQRSEGALDIAQVAGAAAVPLLAAQTYRLHYVAALGQSATHLRLLAATLTTTRLLRLTGAGSVSEVASAIEYATSHARSLT
jgi:hypothetical protein